MSGRRTFPVLLLACFALGTREPAGASERSAPRVGTTTKAAPTTVPATGPATTPDGESAADAARRFIADLDADDYRQRQVAEDGLVSLGESARGLVQELLGRTQDPEVRGRLESALRRVDADRATGPSYVTLHLKDATAGEAFSQLSKQAFVELNPFPENLWDGPGAADLPRVTLDAEREPFWVAFRTLADQTGLMIQRWEGRPRITRGRPPRTMGRSVVSGAFLVVATQVDRRQSIPLGEPGADAAALPARPPIFRNRRDEFGVHLVVIPEPKITVLRTGRIAIEAARDDLGNDLAPPKGGGQTQPVGPGGTWSLYANLNYPDKPGRAIARLSGSVTFVVQSRSQLIEIDDPLDLNGLARNVGATRVTFERFAKTADDAYELRVTFERSPVADPHGPLEEAGGLAMLLQSLQTNLRVLTKDGQALERRGASSQSSGTDGSATLRYAAPPRRGNAAGEPVKFVWEVPVEAKEITVPFEFRDLPMP